MGYLQNGEELGIEKLLFSAGFSGKQKAEGARGKRRPKTASQCSVGGWACWLSLVCSHGEPRWGLHLGPLLLEAVDSQYQQAATVPKLEGED